MAKLAPIPMIATGYARAPRRRKWILLECLTSRQVKAVLRRKLLRMLKPTANIQAMTLLASKYSARIMRVRLLTRTPEAPTIANFQKRPAEGTYQKRLAMCARYSRPCRRLAFETPAWRARKFSGTSTTFSSGAQTSISSSILNPVGRNWMSEIASLRTRKKPVIGSLVLRASLKVIWARYLLLREIARRTGPGSPA